MATITATSGILLLHPNLNATRLRRYNNHHNRNQHPITSLSFPKSTPQLKISCKPPPLKPYSPKPNYFQHPIFASLNPNFSQIPSQKNPFFPKLTKTLIPLFSTPSPHQLETLQYIHDNVTCTVGPLFFASLSSSSINPIGPLKAGLAKWVEFFGPLKTTLWAFLGAVMAKVYEYLGDKPDGLFKASLWPAVAGGLAKWLDIYSGVLIVRILLSWFPNMPWERQPFSAIRHLCDPFLSLFRTIIPPIFGNIDVSPLLAFAVLGTLGSILGNAQVGPL